MAVGIHSSSVVLAAMWWFAATATAATVDRSGWEPRNANKLHRRRLVGMMEEVCAASKYVS